MTTTEAVLFVVGLALGRLGAGVSLARVRARRRQRAHQAGEGRPFLVR